jgi:ribosomal protein S18 acetylase RimI-like enzyme
VENCQTRAVGFDLPNLPVGMTSRPGTRRDADAVLPLLQEWDFAETGEIDTDMADVLMRLPDADAGELPTALLVWADAELVAAAFLSEDEGEVYVRPRHPDGAAVEQTLLRWLAARAAQAGRRLSMMASVSAAERQARYAKAGLAYAHSIFQYSRPLMDLPDPMWPPGFDVQDWAPERDARDVHALIRVAFREVQGQPDLDWPSWSRSVLGRADTAVLIVRDSGRIVGAVVLNSYDTYGHVRQLAVDQGRRGQGFGKALLLTSFQRFAAGALPEVRLGVYASNRTALELYTGAGMTLLTERQVWLRPE